MKRWQFILVIFSTFICTNSKILAQGKNNDDNGVQFKVYRNALALQDFGTAIQALHYIIAGDSVKYGKYEDTLAILYTQVNAFSPAYILSNRLLAQYGYSELRMQIKALAAKNLNEPVEAINAYAELFTRTKNPVYGLEQLQLEYAIRRIGEAIGTGNKLLAIIPVNDSTQVRMARLEQKGMQWVSMRAAIHNILGMSYLDLQDKKNALSQFEDALKEAPDFDQAKNNLNVAHAVNTGTATKP